MSPSEHELRASLRRGEGDGLDVDRIVAAGAVARAHRRNRLAGVAAAVVVVAAAGTLTGVLAGRDGSTTSADSGANADGGARAADSQQRPAIGPAEPAPRAASSTDVAQAPSPQAAAACPAAFPQRTLPGGAQAGRLFDRPAASITVCSYGSPTQSATRPRPGALRLTGTAASELQRSLENAPTSPNGTACTAVRATNQRNLAFVAVDAAGSAMRTVTTTLSIPICDTRTTNGLTVRYGWVPPSSIAPQLYALTPSGVPTTLPRLSPSGKNIGTPAR